MAATEFDICKQEEELNLYEYMFGIDFQGSRRERKFYSNLSFSYLSWRCIESLVNDEFSSKLMDPLLKKVVTFSILPGGQNFLHKLYHKPEVISDIIAGSFE